MTYSKQIPCGSTGDEMFCACGCGGDDSRCAYWVDSYQNKREVDPSHRCCTVFNTDIPKVITDPAYVPGL